MEATLLTAAPEAAPATAERANSRVSLSVAVMTAGPGPRVAAILELLRPVAQEIIVAVDDRAQAEVFEDVSTVADRVIAYPFAEPVDRPLPWLFELCSGEWMLTLDDDEVPSVALLDALPSLCADDRIVHYSLSRRWVFPDAETYLDEPPWQPDYQPRLFRNDRRLIRFSDQLHVPIIPRGPGRFVREPIWHLDTLLRTREQRLAKAHRYEEMRAGMRAGGRSLNYAFYVPELRPDARLTPLPPEERTLVDLVLSARRPDVPAVCEIEAVTRAEIDAHWPRQELEDGRIELAGQVAPFFAGEERALDIVVHNTGEQTWQWGRATLRTVRCATWWDEETRTTALWTPLPSPIAPGESAVVPVHACAPPEPGRHTLHVDLVHEGVRWFGCELAAEIEVRERRRVAFLGASDDAVRELLAAEPDVEPIVLAAEPNTGGYAEAPSPWRYLAEDTPAGRLPFALTFALRGLRLLLAVRSGDQLPRGGRGFLDTIASCERLVVVAQPGATRRERVAAALVVATARLLAVPVVRR